MIYGIGLPRTGTTTLTKALEILGYNGSGYCVLTKVVATPKIGDCQYRVDNSFHTKPEYLRKLIDIIDNRFILTTRPKKRWLKSLSKYEDEANVLISDKKLPYELPYYPWVDIDGYTDYIQSIIPEERLLIVNWDEDPDWDSLCNFLNKDIPIKTDFPCENC
jgi:hypothetical protein